MSLRMKLLSTSLAGVLLTVVASLLVQRSILQNHGIELMRDAMRSVLVGAENSRAAMSEMREKGLIAQDKITLSAGEDFRRSSLYQTIPVVAAWRAIEEVAS